MFVRQIDMKTALELAARGIEIKLLVPNTAEPKRWEDYTPNTLQSVLDGCMFFRQELAMENPELNKKLFPKTPIREWAEFPAWKMGPQWTVVPNGPRKEKDNGETDTCKM